MTPSDAEKTHRPFKVAPFFRTRIWGFEDLAPWFDFKTSGEPIGEVWLTGDQCLVETGPFAGRALNEVVRAEGASLVGAEFVSDSFPLLVKVLFPKEKLSVQVHPDDAMAQKYGDPRGKTECWYALDAEPGAQVALGSANGEFTDRAQVIFVSSGEATLHSEDGEALFLKRCELAVVPASTGAWRVKADDAAEVIRIVPQSGSAAN